MSEPRYEIAAVVLGMHRSGTSALAGILALTGFDPPSTLLPSSAVNERGFWESERINALNDAFFAEFGMTWHSLGAIPFGQLGKQTLRSARARAKAVLTNEFSKGTRPLIKDPRLSRLLPLWKPALTELAERTVVAIAVRNPLEVARSLTQRNEFDADQSYLLWARYYLAAEFHTRGLPRAWIAYDALLDDWREAVRPFYLEVSPDFRLNSEDEENANQFVSGHLRHHHAPDEQAAVELARLPIVEQAYRVLMAWTCGKPSTDADLEILDEARRRFDDLSGTISQVVESARLDRKRLANAKAQADAATAELARAHKVSETLDRLQASLDKQATAQAALELRIKSTVASLIDAVEARSALESQLTEAGRERSALQGRLAETEAHARNERTRLQGEAAEASAARDKLGRELEQQRVETRQAEKEGERRAAEITAEFDKKLAALQSQQDATETELKDVKRKYRSTQHQLARDRDKLRRTQEQLAQVEQRLERIKGSAVWRLYVTFQGVLRRTVSIFSGAIVGTRRRRQAECVALLRQSALFDGDWYLARYPDVAAANIAPALHYLEHGWREGRDPGPKFSTASYLKSNGDVAAAGLNPLLHYIEFGYSEGRHITELSRPQVTAQESSDDNFAPAAPCVGFPILARPLIRWRRAARLAQVDTGVISVRGEPVGIVARPKHGAVIEAAFDRLAALSGLHGDFVRHESAIDPLGQSIRPVDVWYVNVSRLRCRWAVKESPIVVRGYQYPDNAERPRLVGEGITVSPLDFIDFELLNPYFPVLFVLSDTDGQISSVECLEFPSLCRGGLHYSELLAFKQSSSNEPLDVMRVANVLADELIAIVDGSFEPFIGKLMVDLSGADGTEPIFQEDFRAWLARVMRVGMQALDSRSPTPDRLELARTIELTVEARDAGSAMTIPADTIPSIGALTMRAGSRDEDAAVVVLPLIIGSCDSAQPATLIHLPPITPNSFTEAANHYPSAWPRLSGEKRRAPGRPLDVAALRRLRRPPPSDSELLLPVSPPALNIPPSEQAITWLIFVDDWDDEPLREALKALSLQQASQPLALSLVSEREPSIAIVAKRLFAGRISISADVTTALAAVRTSLVGYLGAHVLLHDQRTCRVLTALLADSSVVSASCALVTPERRGKGWHVSLTDPGEFGQPRAHDPANHQNPVSGLLFWRSTYPALRPPRDLWIGRLAIVRGWLERAGPLRPDEGVHACTSQITASYVGAQRPESAHLRPPAAAQVQSIRSEVLFG